MNGSLRVITSLVFPLFIAATLNAEVKAAGADGPAARQAIIEVLGDQMLDNYNKALDSDSDTKDLSCEEGSKSDISIILGISKNKKLKGNKNNKSIGAFLKQIGIIASSGDSISLLFSDAAESAAFDYCFGDDDGDDDENEVE